MSVLVGVFKEMKFRWVSLSLPAKIETISE